MTGGNNGPDPERRLCRPPARSTNRFANWFGSHDRPDTFAFAFAFAFGSVPLGLLKQIIGQIRERGRVRTVPRDHDLAG